MESVRPTPPSSSKVDTYFVPLPNSLSSTNKRILCIPNDGQWTHFCIQHHRSTSPIPRKHTELSVVSITNGVEIQSSEMAYPSALGWKQARLMDNYLFCKIPSNLECSK